MALKIHGFGACMIKGYPSQEGNSFFHQALARVKKETSQDLDSAVIALEGFPASRAQKYLKPKVLCDFPDVVVFQFGSSDAYTSVNRFFAEPRGTGATRKAKRTLDLKSIARQRRWKWTLMGILGDLFNIGPNTSCDDYVNALESMVAEVRAHGAIPVVLSPFVIGGFRSDRYARLFATELRKKIAAIPSVRYIDAYSALNRFPRKRVLLQDGLHLSERGHEIIADALTDCLLEIQRTVSLAKEVA